MTEDLHTLGFRAGLAGKEPQHPDHPYYMMAYRDGCQERERQAETERKAA